MNPRLASAICSNVDPFCVHAQGAKMFDRSSSRSVPISLTQTLSLTTNSDGNAALLVYPTLNNQVYEPTTIVSQNEITSWTSYANAPYYTELGDNFYNYRCVTGGVRMFTTANATTASGIAGMALLAQKGSNPPPVNLDGAGFLEYNRTAVPGMDMAAVMKPQDLYTDFNDIGTAEIASLTPILVWVRGGPASTTIAFIEITVNFELIPKPDTFANLMATPAYPHSPEVEAASSNILSDIAGVFTNGVKALTNEAGSMAKQHGAAIARGAAVGLITGGPAGAAAGGSTALMNEIITVN